MHLDYTKVIILILWWRNFQLEYWRTFQLVSTKKADNVWTAGLYVFGFSPAAENILAVEVLMKEEDSVFNERQSVDLTPYLRGFDGDEISLELDLHIGRELEIGGPVIIPDWEDTPETEFP